MINVVYLVLVFFVDGHGGAGGVTSVTIPQANMKQCLVNKKGYDQRTIAIPNINTSGVKADCIIGVK